MNQENKKIYEEINESYKIDDRPTDRFSTSCFEWLESIAQAVIVVVISLSFIFRIVNISGWSMLNTLRDGDKVVVLKWNYVPHNGDVVVITKGQFLDEPLVKRVIATENQSFSIDFKSGKVMVDGKTLDETYIREPMWLQGDNNIPDIIPPGHSFVMGDNRNHSMDSRFKNVGIIPNENIVGKAAVILFPFDRFKII
ncbi:MAG: signal peptidase I [Oscillospiraceae bacterium]|nr:signal peptidase I [Oscillospiraceae bacterium]